LNGQYVILPAVATSTCSSTISISYEITGATTRNGTGIDASGSFNPGVSNIRWIISNSCGATTECSTTVTITDLVVPTFNDIASICEGSAGPVLPNISIEGITGTWTPGIINTNIPGKHYLYIHT
jgi:hypothetical protein